MIEANRLLDVPVYGMRVHVALAQLVVAGEVNGIPAVRSDRLLQSSSDAEDTTAAPASRGGRVVSYRSETESASPIVAA
jgi:hypothetical protein